MQEFFTNFNSQTGNLHHAYFVVGERGMVVSELLSFLENSLGMQVAGNPDVWQGEFDTLTIDEARKIATAQESRDFSGGRKIFILSTNFITEEAQNALLKVFEEPTTGTHFFIISPQDMLLPTLRSRMHILHKSNVLSKGDNDEEKSILAMSFKDRLELVKKITQAISDEENTKQDALALVNRVERELYRAGVMASHSALEVSKLSRRALHDRGAPVKMILENMMLAI